MKPYSNSTSSGAIYLKQSLSSVAYLIWSVLTNLTLTIITITNAQNWLSFISLYPNWTKSSWFHSDEPHLNQINHRTIDMCDINGISAMARWDRTSSSDDFANESQILTQRKIFEEFIKKTKPRSRSSVTRLMFAQLTQNWYIAQW